jgi:hypothetical protein
MWIFVVAALQSAAAELCDNRADCQPKCAEGSTVETDGWTDLCRRTDGELHGPFVHWTRSGRVLDGVFEHGEPAHRWRRVERGQVRVSSGPPDLRDCELADVACWTQAAVAKLDAVKTWAAEGTSPALVRTDGGRKLPTNDDWGKQRPGAPRTVTYDVMSYFRITPEPIQRLKVRGTRTQVWSAAGALIADVEHTVGGTLHGRAKWMTRSKKPVREAHYEDGRLQGAETTWWPNGQKRCEVGWWEGTPHGHVRCWSSAAEQNTQGGFKMGEACGVFSIGEHRPMNGVRCGF